MQSTVPCAVYKAKYDEGQIVLSRSDRLKKELRLVQGQLMFKAEHKRI
jgi:hypothetical protein